MVAALVDEGNKYTQQVTPSTPAYAASGVRMEDAHAIRKGVGDRLVIAVADGHGSIKLADGVFVGARECADAACSVATRMASSPGASSSQVFASCQAAAEAQLRAHPHTMEDDGVLRVLSHGGRPTVPACGATLSVAVLRPGRPSSFAWVGDSVGLLVRADGSHLPLGHPHSVSDPSERARMRAAGARVDGKYFEYRAHGSAMRIAIGRSIGHVGHSCIDSTPSVVTFVPQPGDRVVVATDGLWDVCTRSRAAALVSSAPTEAQACESLMALSRSSPSPRDNSTVVCAFVDSPRAEEACCSIS